MMIYYSLLHYFQPFCRYMFQRPLSPSSALLQLSGSSTGLQTFVFNGFMYFEIKFFSSGISKLKMMFLFFWMKIFSQIVSYKGFSACFNNLASFSTLCCVIQKWYATADFSILVFYIAEMFFYSGFKVPFYFSYVGFFTLFAINFVYSGFLFCWNFVLIVRVYLVFHFFFINWCQFYTNFLNPFSAKRWLSFTA